ncbi:MAG: radical SAM family heme chaperone HemW [Pseudomonadota bacterium]
MIFAEADLPQATIDKAVGPDYGFGLYMHWPYCSKICPYCDFNVYAAKDRDSTPLLNAILDDIRAHKSVLSEHPPLTSIFLGGGTPSLLKPHEIEQIVEASIRTFGLVDGGEVTIEVNPDHVATSDLKGWSVAGINRVSLGVQALDDVALSFLGRTHSVSDAKNAVKAVERHFENFSCDLIYARPGQSLNEWKTELAATLRLGAPHLSLYELTIEERTAFGKRAARGEILPLDDDAQADLYELTQDICDAAGLPAYEVSNHALSEAFESQHNHIYWANGDWIGVGPGAHGRLTYNGVRFRTEATRRPADYILGPMQKREKLSSIDVARELIPMGLRPRGGLDLNRLYNLGFARLSVDDLAPLIQAELMRVSNETVSLTPAGRLMADGIAKHIAKGMNI